MKPKSLLPVLALGLFTILYTSCKKDDTTTAADPTEIETTFALSGNQAIADNLTEDANNIMMSVADEKNLTGNKGGGPTTDNFLCATVTVTPQSGFPKTVIIDFGPLPGCTAPNGVIRSGKIQVVISDSLRHPQSTAVMTFDNYHVNGYKKEGTITWTNTSTPGVRSWRREVVNGKITAPNGNWWMHDGVKEIVQTEGAGTINPADDVFHITGHGTTTNSQGHSRSHLITEFLEKKNSCEWIDKGKIRFEGPNHFAILDFGNGDCDNHATVTIDGQTVHNILLP